MKIFSMHHGLMKKPFASGFIGILLRGGDENGQLLWDWANSHLPAVSEFQAANRRQVFLTRLLMCSYGNTC